MRAELEAVMYSENESKIIYPQGDSSPVPGANYLSTKNSSYEDKIRTSVKSQENKSENIFVPREIKAENNKTDRAKTEYVKDNSSETDNINVNKAETVKKTLKKNISENLIYKQAEEAFEQTQFTAKDLNKLHV